MEHYNPILSSRPTARNSSPAARSYRHYRIADAAASSTEASYGGSRAPTCGHNTAWMWTAGLFGVVLNNSLGGGAGCAGCRSNDVRLPPRIPDRATQQDLPQPAGAHYLETGYGIRASRSL